MQINPYLNFNGTCAEAMKFYAGLLGGKIETLMTHGEAPPSEHIPADWKGKIMHAHVVAKGFELMGSDAPPNYYKTPQGFAVSLHVTDPKEAERVYAALADKGNVTMPLAKTFWAEKFAMLTDRFGTPWIINCAPVAGA